MLMLSVLVLMLSVLVLMLSMLVLVLNHVCFLLQPHVFVVTDVICGFVFQRKWSCFWNCMGILLFGHRLHITSQEQQLT